MEDDEFRCGCPGIMASTLAFNRTRVVLKLMMQGFFGDDVLPFNRTRVVLKHSWLWNGCCTCDPFNRTRVVLKHGDAIPAAGTVLPLLIAPGWY